MALAQISLKLPPDLAADWRRRAAEAGHRSVRDWLIATISPAAESAPDILDRVAALEEELTALRAAVSQLQSSLPGPRLQPPATAAPPAGAAGAGPITTAQLAASLGMKPGTITERIRRSGGARPGLELSGWRCIGTARPPRGGPEQAQWVPADTGSAAAG